MNRNAILAKRIVLPVLMLLFAFAVNAQHKLNQPNYFNHLSIDPVLTVRNTGNAVLPGFQIHYVLNSAKVQVYHYPCPVEAFSTVNIILPRSYGNGMLAFDGWISSTDEAKQAANAATIESATFLFSPEGNAEAIKVGSVADPVFPAPQTDEKEFKKVKPSISLLISAFMSDENKLSAFASTDKGKFWFRGEWERNEANAENDNAVQFKDKKETLKKCRLLIASKPVESNDVSNYSALKLKISPVECAKELFTADIYPNPFTSNISIQYEVTATTVVNISIANAAGVVVAKPLDAVNKEKGRYSLNFNGANLAAGTYFCTIKFGTTVKTIRIVKN